MYDLVVRDGMLVSAAGERPGDVAVQDGRIASIAAPMSLGPAAQVIDAGGRHVLPGLVDAHVHLRDPGFTHKEDFGSGTMAAAAGGVTTVMAIPNTDPPIATPAAFQAAVRAAEGKAAVDFALLAGVRIAEPEGVAAFARSPAIAFDLLEDPYRAGTKAWLELFRRLREVRLPLCLYLNDEALREHCREALAARGFPAHQVWAGSTPGALEVLCMGRIIPLAAHFGVPVVLRSVTTAEGLAFARHMRRAYPRTRVMVETNPHYLFLTAEDLAAMGARAYMSPPLRPAGELSALWEAVHDGTVDYLGTDHAPHAPAEKASGDLFATPPGIIGLETMLPLLLTARAQGRLGITDIVRLCCEAPARAFGVYPEKGSIAVGADADLVVVDLAERWRIDAGRFYSRGDRGPFDGWEVTGRPHLTLVRGQVAMADGVVAPSGRGRLVAPTRDGTPS